jgi:glycerol-3-phosphate acyltransferase PlsY
MDSLLLLLWIPAGYVLGSFPTSIIAGHLARGIDIREHGSGNAGATNTVRILGAGWGVAVGLVDLFKGWLPVFLAAFFGAPDWLQVLTGVAAVAGHAFPLFAGFRGGKGVATGAGMVLALFPLAFLICLATFAVLLFSTGIVSLGSIAAAAMLPLSVLFAGGGLESFRAGDPEGIGIWAFSLLLGIFVIVLHRKNIGRLLKGEERRFDKIWIFRPRSGK